MRRKETITVKCDYCLKENNEKLNFCEDCGNPLNDEAKRHFPELIKPKKSKLEKEI